ncbi:MAG: hypothetical protein WCC11_08010 [Gammaproteobacteria bacterium]
MFKHLLSKLRLPGLAAPLLLGLFLAQPAQAMLGSTPLQIGRGLIQNIDYLHHAITVNGQTYAVSPQAKFSGIAAFSVLHIGMPISFALDNAPEKTPATDPSVPVQTSSDTPLEIVQITWLPGGV